MMKHLQKLGKALMLPVAVLPICGILMGLGYAFAPGVMGVPGAATSGAAYTVGFLLVKAGGALIDNMAWLFAIGAAVGLADDHDGTAGLAGLVSFLMMQQLLSPAVVGAVRTLEEGTATYIAFQKVAGNSFIGILAAVVGATCYNKFKNTQMPDWLAFFSGKRFVAIATGLISIVVSVVLLFVWPVIFGALVALGKGIAGIMRDYVIPAPCDCEDEETERKQRESDEAVARNEDFGRQTYIASLRDSGLKDSKQRGYTFARDDDPASAASIRLRICSK